MTIMEIIACVATFWALYGILGNIKLKNELTQTKQLLSEADSLRGAWKLLAHRVVSSLPKDDKSFMPEFHTLGRKDADLRL